MSQKDFALKMETTQQRVSEWECDKVEPSLYNIIKTDQSIKTVCIKDTAFKSSEALFAFA